jgi:hypothetical protein
MENKSIAFCLPVIQQSKLMLVWLAFNCVHGDTASGDFCVLFIGM